MSEEALSQAASAVIFDELAEAAPGITFDGPDVQPFAFGQEGPRPAERLTGLERMGEKIARAIRFEFKKETVGIHPLKQPLRHRLIAPTRQTLADVAAA